MLDALTPAPLTRPLSHLHCWQFPLVGAGGDASAPLSLFFTTSKPPAS